MKLKQLQLMEETLALNLEEIEGPAAGEALATAHLEAHRRILDAQRARVRGAPASFDHAVDGRRGRPLTEARAQIVTLYDYRLEAALFAIERLIDNSPEVSGAYKRSHQLFVDGRPVTGLPREVSPAAEVMVTNTVPYARRLEVGKTKSGRSFVTQVPPDIYWRTILQVRRRYGQAMNIYLNFVDLSDAYVTKRGLQGFYGTGKAAGPRGGGTLRKRQQKAGVAVRYPAIRFHAL